MYICTYAKEEENASSNKVSTRNANERKQQREQKKIEERIIADSDHVRALQKENYVKKKSIYSANGINR